MPLPGKKQGPYATDLYACSLSTIPEAGFSSGITTDDGEITANRTKQNWFTVKPLIIWVINNFIAY